MIIEGIGSDVFKARNVKLDKRRTKGCQIKLALCLPFPAINQLGGVGSVHKMFTDVKDVGKYH